MRTGMWLGGFLALLILAAALAWGSAGSAAPWAGPGMMGRWGMGGGAMWGHMQQHHGYAGTAAEKLPAVTADPAAPRVPVRVTLNEWKLAPSRLEGEAGQVLRISIANTGAVPHRFAIPALEVGVGPLRPGETRTVEVALEKPGEFDVYCDIPGHREAGQRAVLAVR